MGFSVFTISKPIFFLFFSLFKLYVDGGWALNYYLKRQGEKHNTEKKELVSQSSPAVSVSKKSS